MEDGMALDDRDRELLALLTEDARMPLTGLARRLGVARSTVQQRLARLEADGVIAGYSVRLGPAARAGVRAHVSLVVEARRAESIVATLSGWDEVRAVYAVSGQHDLVVLVRSPTPDDLDALIDRIAAVDGVERTVSAVILATKLER
jgi:DNA-binding Lrp family transcriptional regulator